MQLMIFQEEIYTIVFIQITIKVMVLLQQDITMLNTIVFAKVVSE